MIVGIGGTPKNDSSTEQALQIALRAATAAGAQTCLFGGQYLAKLPIYLTQPASLAGDEMIAAVRKADGLILASPGYHGSVSGALKNASDYMEVLARDARVYLDGLPVGLIVTAFGWQATGSTLAALRAVVHALRGWPTPLGVAVNTSAGIFNQGQCSDPEAERQLNLVGVQVTKFAKIHMLDSGATGTG
jgi:FMN reductase